MTNLQLSQNFGDRLREERTRLAMTQDELAERAGVKRLTIAQYEKGATSPTMEFVYSLQGLGFRLPYLIFAKSLVAKPNDFPPQVLNFVAGMVSTIEQKLADGYLSNEAKLRMMLLLLAKYTEEPEHAPLTELQAMDYLLRS